MRKNRQLSIILMIIMSMLLGACASATTGNGKSPAQAAAAAVNPAASSTPAPTMANLLPSQDVLTLFKNVMSSIPPTQGYGYIQPDALKADLAFQQPPFIIDVRDPQEIQNSGFIMGAINIPLRNLLDNLDKLPAQNAKIVLYSNAGYRSGMALAALTILGYTDVHDVAGGYSTFSRSEPKFVVTGSMPPAPKVVTASPVISNQADFKMLDSFLNNLPNDYYQIVPLTLSNELTGDNPPTLIDMNTASDHQQYGYIPGANFILFNDFFNDISQLPAQNAPIVIYAVGGGHSSILVMGLRLMGYTNVVSLKGGIIGWKDNNLPVKTSGGS